MPILGDKGSSTKSTHSLTHSPATLGDGFIDGLVHLLVVVVLIAGMLPHMRLQGRRVATDIATKGTPVGADGNENETGSHQALHTHPPTHTHTHTHTHYYAA